MHPGTTFSAAPESTTKHRSPPESPGLLCSTSEEWNFFSCTGARQLTQEPPRLPRPTAANLHRQHHKLGTAVRAHELWSKSAILSFRFTLAMMMFGHNPSSMLLAQLAWTVHSDVPSALQRAQQVSGVESCQLRLPLPLQWQPIVHDNCSNGVCSSWSPSGTPGTFQIHRLLCHSPTHQLLVLTTSLLRVLPFLPDSLQQL